MVSDNLPLFRPAGWEGFRNRDKSEDLPYYINRSKLSGRKALDYLRIPLKFLAAQKGR